MPKRHADYLKELARSIETRGPVAPQWDLNGDGRIDKDDVNLVALAAVHLDKGA
jgi:hypothetical protein